MLNKIKDKIKFKLADILTPEVDKKLNIDDKLNSVTLYGIAPWYQENLWEPTVQIALRDLCKPGDVVFDVGANFAGLTTVMSRLVGPRGVVCAFEASPRIVDKTQRNLVLSGCHNTQLFHQAVYHTSGETVKIYLGSHLNDSIYSEHGTGSTYEVKTIALDDFVGYTNLVPNLLKMDIEGAEFDALQGFETTLKTAKPHLILETQREDTRCLDFLRALGYIAIDLNTYQEVKTVDDYPVGVDIRNNLYIHGDRLAETLYKPPFTFEQQVSITAGDFQQTSNGSAHLKQLINLPKGRYLIDMDFQAEGKSNDLMCGVTVNDKVIFRYHAYSQLLASSYRDWVINLPEAAAINLYFEFQHGTQDETLTIAGAKITRITDFDQQPAALYF
ncbi:MAG: FkbM family methyltransferase [Synechocystis sp.]